MDQHSVSSEITYHHEPAENTKHIWKIFWLLLFLTMIELGIGLTMYATNMPHWVEMFLKGVIVILTLAKAFYIITVFMHLGDEIRNMIMTISVPLLLFIWFIAAFLWDGNEYRVMRNRYNPHTLDQSTHVNITPKSSSDTAKHPLD